MATLVEIRQQHPEYGDLNDQQLADGLYNKFYSDMPREQFDQKLGLAPSRPASDGYQPSAVPIMDGINAAANNFVRNIPIAGPTLESWGNNVDATINNALGFDHQTPDDRAQQNQAEMDQFPIQAGAGGVAGAVLPLVAAGGVAPVVARGLGMTGGLGSQVLFGGLSGAGISAADTKARGGSNEDALWAGAGGAALGSAAPLVFKGLGAGFNALTGRNVPKAAQNIGQALRDDDIAPAAVNRMMAQMGPDSALMDLGPNMQTLAGGVASVRGPGQKVLRDAVSTRAKAASQRMGADIGATLGRGQDIGALTEQIVTSQKAAADPLYAAVRNVPVTLDGNLKFVASTPLGKAAFDKAAALAANDGASGQGVTVGFLDYAKRALDDVAGAAKRGGENNAARQAAQMAKILTTEIDKRVPAYKAARDAFAGPAAVLDAIETGQGAFKADTSPAAMQSMLGQMTASEKDAFLQGAQASVADMIGNATNDIRKVRDLIRKPYNEAKLRVLIGDGATDDLLKAVDREFMFGQTAHVVAGNSETARRTAAQGMVNPEMAPVPRPQGVTGLVFAALDSARARLRGTLQPKVNRQMADMLSGGPLSPQQMSQLARGAKTPARLPIAPASAPLLSLGNEPSSRRMPEITVHPALPVSR